MTIQARAAGPSPRIGRLLERMRAEERVMSLEQALIVTRSYRDRGGLPRTLQRAWAFADALDAIAIAIDPEELIVGNRTAEVRAGVVFPEGGISWVARELETLATRRQDPFVVREGDAERFRAEVLPAWQGRSLEDQVSLRLGARIREVASVVKINQTDHAQGHIAPDVAAWLRRGPAGLLEDVARQQAVRSDGTGSGDASGGAALQYEAMSITLTAAQRFMRRYAELARRLERADIAEICETLATRPPGTFHEALQSLWFLFVMLQMESNASSFSPGRMDQYLLSYYRADRDAGRLDENQALELIEALWLKFNQIVYMRSAGSAQYFAGFPIGFNIAIGGMDREGVDATNELSYLFLQAQEELGLPQPNLSARIWSGSPDTFVDRCARVIGAGSGMPQIVSDESIIPALQAVGIEEGDARDYAVVGCVELSPQGNTLAWSDAAMFNLVKVLELALNDGRCMLSGEQMGPHTGFLPDFARFDDLLEAYRIQLDFFVERMMPLCDAVDRMHAELLPSPFLSTVVDGCISSGRDVTAGGARYNLSGIQAIQPANLADSLAAVRQLVYEQASVAPSTLLAALHADFEGHEALRQRLLHQVPKYGNDVASVDELGAMWIDAFADRLEEWTNARGGRYQMGLYTVSAHVPMGKNVAATPDGRRAREPLADGGLSAMYGRDTQGPTALLTSVSRINSRRAGNGTLLNLKFLPEMFTDPRERAKFVAMLRTLGPLGIHHAQFNVVRRETLIAAQASPEEYRSLTIRVAGYTAYFTELAPDLQAEIIARTAYGSA